MYINWEVRELTLGKKETIQHSMMLRVVTCGYEPWICSCSKLVVVREVNVVSQVAWGGGHNNEMAALLTDHNTEILLHHTVRTFQINNKQRADAHMLEVMLLCNITALGSDAWCYLFSHCGCPVLHPYFCHEWWWTCHSHPTGLCLLYTVVWFLQIRFQWSVYNVHDM